VRNTHGTILFDGYTLKDFLDIRNCAFLRRLEPTDVTYLPALIRPGAVPQPEGNRNYRTEYVPSSPPPPPSPPFLFDVPLLSSTLSSHSCHTIITILSPNLLSSQQFHISTTLRSFFFSHANTTCRHQSYRGARSMPKSREVRRLSSFFCSALPFFVLFSLCFRPFSIISRKA
jgi:hypothetical protein